MAYISVFILSFLVFFSYGNPMTRKAKDENPSVTKLRDYLRINTAHPTPDYWSAVLWLRMQGEGFGLDYNLLQMDEPNLFAMWFTWHGTDPSLPSILLNSHMDVVAVDPAKWDHDPFSGFKDENGYIYGRGAVDMKSATVAQLEAIRALKQDGFQPIRNIHMVILPDEEIGGERGMHAFTTTPEFRSLNVGFDIDEATTSGDNNTMYIAHGEKSIWQFNITVSGTAGHGSTLPTETAGEKLQIVIDRLMAFRQTQVGAIEAGTPIANVTSLNLVRVGGGMGDNIIPGEFWASFDMRIRVRPGWNYTDVEEFLEGVLQEAGEGSSIKYISKSLISAQTPADEGNGWWVELMESCSQLGVNCVPSFLNGGTDGRYARDIGIPVLGINPFLNTPFALAHADNERINEQEFLAGIGRYATIIRNMASLVSSPS